MRELLDRARTQRETEVYPSLFGRSLQVAQFDPGFFKRTFEQEAELNWLETSVFESAPNEKHQDFVYVSSGLSNPLPDALPPAQGDYSWLGVEIVLRTTESGGWAVQTLQRAAAFEILLAHERFPNRDRLNPGARIPLGGSIVPGTESKLKFLLVVPSPKELESFELASGRVDFLNVVGITEQEAKFAREQGTETLYEQLRNHNALWVTDPKRDSLVAG